MPASCGRISSTTPPQCRRRASRSIEDHMTDLNSIRTDVVGSLLRPASWRQAREQYDGGKIDLAALRAVEDRCIRDFIRLQESIGLDVVTDGEISRLNFQDGFGMAMRSYHAATQ